MKKSLLKRIVVYGIIVALIMFITLTIFSLVFYNDLTIKYYSKNMDECAEKIQNMYTGYGIGLEEFSDYYMSRGRFRTLLKDDCSYYDLKYLYIYAPHDDFTSRKYYFTVASDSEEDIRVDKQRGYGVIINKEFRQIEKDVYNGKVPTGTVYTDNEFGRVYTWYYPVKDYNGEIIALLALDYDAGSFFATAIKDSLYLIIPSFVLLTSMLVLLIFGVKRGIFIPIRQLSQKMYDYDPSSELDLTGIKRDGEIGDIANSFEKMSDTIKEYIEDIKVLSDERASATAELNIARKIQMGMTPKDLEIRKDYFEVRAYAHPAKEVGGDFYSCFEDGRYVYVLIGDVSGKGVAAAMFMSMTMSIVREKLRSGLTPAEALNASNVTLCDENPEGMFVTIQAGIYDTFTGDFRYANAGHTKPVIVSKDKRFVEPDPGIALGLFEDSDIVDEYITLHEGEGILLYTDGATDAVNSDHLFFGENGILDLVDPAKGSDNTKILAERLEEFSGENDQFDDITLITLFRSKAPSNVIAINVAPPELDAFDEFKDKLIEIHGMSGFTKKMILACEEIFANIVDYSNSDHVGLYCANEGTTTVVRFEDSGIPFDPVASDMGKKDFDEMDQGGMGILIVRQIASDISYKRMGDRNVLTLTFEVE